MIQNSYAKISSIFQRLDFRNYYRKPTNMFPIFFQLLLKLIDLPSNFVETIGDTSSVYINKQILIYILYIVQGNNCFEFFNEVNHQMHYGLWNTRDCESKQTNRTCRRANKQMEEESRETIHRLPSLIKKACDCRLFLLCTPSKGKKIKTSHFSSLQSLSYWMSYVGAKWFPKLYRRFGYHQLWFAIRDEDEYKPAFKTHRDLFEFKVMSFGLTNSLASF